jgi:hypothetical protein
MTDAGCTRSPVGPENVLMTQGVLPGVLASTSGEIRAASHNTLTDSIADRQGGCST